MVLGLFSYIYNTFYGIFYGIFSTESRFYYLSLISYGFHHIHKKDADSEFAIRSLD